MLALINCYKPKHYHPYSYHQYLAYKWILLSLKYLGLHRLKTHKQASPRLHIPPYRSHLNYQIFNIHILQVHGCPLENRLVHIRSTLNLTFNILITPHNASIIFNSFLIQLYTILIILHYLSLYLKITQVLVCSVAFKLHNRNLIILLA